MTAKVQHAVYSAQEGRAGLVVALNNIAQAYADVMEARARGELVGDFRRIGGRRDHVTAAGIDFVR